ncbi:uncharacterized protein A1O9_01916 [Exophiala aquamarina CBS 119918]|uniref:Uncharacterized protein n=1 Tax=Exophiala aquamarina CBS 119918 TaxID=1182545 RepID=A0A072PKG1_9EURO|nr:uncharacterized protein A1O9_01916 [Exophiala aquamarina CBS 119918]KEF60356.1 hypothetical protein A1O9_01916 [Exophiala aquamarina CBS 119918]
MNTLSSFWQLAILALLAHQSLLVSAQSCPPFTPNLPISGPLADNKAIADAIQNVTTVITAIEGSGVLIDNDTSYSVDFYSLHDKGSLFTYHFSAPNLQRASQGVTSVDSNTIYRIGSISKVFTVYTYLANQGDDTWNQPITKYVPELAEAASSTVQESDIDVLRWDQVTIGSLASHLSGVSRDVQRNLRYTNEELAALGLPPASSPNVSYCGVPEVQYPCDRSALFENILRRHPVIAPFYAPTYSNLAFQLLAYALENMTSTPFDDLVNATLSDISLNSTYLNVPPTSDNAVIPVNDTTSLYSADLGPLGPGGAFYSTINDLRNFGLSILNYTVLPPSQTRRWLKPHSFTPDTYMTVGAPWEIVPYPPDDRYPTRIYAKSGGIGLYSAEMGLIPDYNVGFTILAAGPLSPLVNAIGADLISSTFLTAVKAAAREQTEQNYAGLYEDEATNSSLALSVVDGVAGGSNLHIDSWTWEGEDLTALLGSAMGVNTTILSLDLNLFPTGLAGKGPDSNEVVSWRTSYSYVIPDATTNSDDNTSEDTSSSTSITSLMGPFSLACSSWAAIDAVSYGGISFDEIVFNVDSESGEVQSAEVRVLRSGAFEKVSSGSGNSTLLKRGENFRMKMARRHPETSPYVLRT